LLLPLLAVLLSLLALLAPVSDTVPGTLGVKVSVQLFKVAPIAKDAEAAGQLLATAPDGNVPVKLQLALVAAAVALALLVQVSVQVTGLPTVAGSGLQLIAEVISENVAATTVTLLVAVLLAGFESLVAPVLPVTVTGPDVVGVPETAHVTV
jgi:hypothetical protein